MAAIGSCDITLYKLAATSQAWSCNVLNGFAIFLR